MKPKRTNEQMVIDKDFNALYKQNRKFIIKIALTYKVENSHKVDLIQAGRIGLFQAMERFNPDNNNNFLTYAVHWIKREMSMYISNNIRTVRIPLSVLKNKDREILPTEKMLSLDSPLNNEDNQGDNLSSIIPYDESELKEDDDKQHLIKVLLKQHLEKLKPQYQTIIKMRYFNDFTFVKIANELGTTRQDITTKHNLAMNKMKKFFNVNQ